MSDSKYAQSSAAEDAARSAALADALRPDEVYVVHVESRHGTVDGESEVRVFGHREDAEAFAQALLGEFASAMDGAVIATPVCDHATARRLIEQEG